MPDSEAKKRWMKEHTTVCTVKFNHNTDKDLLDFLQGKAKQTVIKAALREYVKTHEDLPE